jgi:hypothetical protein
MITSGYAFAPNGTQIQFDPTQSSGQPVSVQLTQAYFPANYATGLGGAGPGGFRDFGDAGAGAIPYRVSAGRCIRVPAAEAAALIAAGVAVGV